MLKELIKDNYNLLIIILIIILLIGIIIMLIPIILKKDNSNTLTNKGLTDKDLQKIDKNISKEQLTKELFELYKKSSIAKSKFDYKTLKELLESNYYEEIEKSLKELKTNKQKIISTNINLIDLKILSLDKKDDLETIKLYLHVSQYDYIINNKKEIIRGTDESEYQIEYKITVERTKNNSFKIKTQQCTGKWIKTK